MLSIVEVAKKLGLVEEDLELYGKDKAKLPPSVWEKIKGQPDGQLILVTAITPTPAGEGKTVTTIGLAQGLACLGERVVAALREPSLGPVFGMKGGATGGGKAQVEPAEEINLHFTGDFHALTSAQNLLAALIDNHLYFGNELQLDKDKIAWHRALDVNDRALRRVTVAVGQKGERQERFLITAASELMAVLCLATDGTDLRNRLARIIVGYTGEGKPVTADDLKAVGALTKLLKFALWPNLVQTTEGVPTLIHGGPFGNIAHGCSSLIATRYALKLADFVVTEAGFGADLGAEKFFDIKCRVGGLTPSLAVVVATVRALKYHGGGGEELKSIKSTRSTGSGLMLNTAEASKVESAGESLEAVVRGMENLRRHVENLKKFGVPVVVAVNRFAGDTEEEIKVVLAACASWGVPSAVSDGFNRGGEGCRELANLVASQTATHAGPAVGQPQQVLADGCALAGAPRPTPPAFHPLYSLEIPLKRKIETVAREIYGADGVDYSEAAEKEIARLGTASGTPVGSVATLATHPTGESLAFLPVCIAKTQYSFSDDPKKLNVPKGFRLNVREVYPAAGAGFVVVLTGEIMTMPGLPRQPLAEGMA